MASEVTTIRFRDDELAELDAFAAHWRITRNGVVRIAVCRLLGLRLPAWADRLADELDETLARM